MYKSLNGGRKGELELFFIFFSRFTQTEIEKNAKKYHCCKKHENNVKFIWCHMFHLASLVLSRYTLDNNR